jgi:hypothetical protein
MIAGPGFLSAVVRAGTCVILGTVDYHFPNRQLLAAAAPAKLRSYGEQPQQCLLVLSPRWRRVRAAEKIVHPIQPGWLHPREVLLASR